MDGYYFGSAYNRALFGLALQSTTSLTILSQSEWYLILRIISAGLALLVFWWSVKGILSVSTKGLSVGILLLGYSLIFTFNHGWESPSDFLDLLFFALLVYFAVRKHYTALLVTSHIGAINRESVVFSSLLWICLYGINQRWHVRWQEVLRAAFLGISTYTTVIALRYWFGGLRAITQNTQSLTFFDDLVDSFREWEHSIPLIGHSY